MKLYAMQGACSLASHVALVWAGVPYDLKMLSHQEAGGSAFKAINPKGAVPTLVLDNGTVLTESLATLQYIADLAPDLKLGANPGDILARAQMNELLADLVSDVHKAWAPVFVPSRYVTQKANEDDAKQAALAQLDTQYTRLDRMMQGRDWALFDRRTVADAYLYVMCRWKDKTPHPIADYPALAAFKTRMDKNAGVQRALNEEG